ncbi:hypothetical protein Bphy_0595 [Paraburkholderia phymatum STM815]|uniref:Uncharacterized protein n=1 Tax=Paraburkholderia phymatum (strain DSM 17167 / CIP 108236 / LMG 21445 / STM815) TaxID=391038 RepID=B2JE10_PARP8|nr:hypothetical protein Bphy_0595 [Paraburkholderia phymatum STM815]
MAQQRKERERQKYKKPRHAVAFMIRTACAWFARIRDEASGAPMGAASGDVEVRTGCGSCAKEYDNACARVNLQFA